MIKNYFVVAIRNLRNQKMYSLNQYSRTGCRHCLFPGYFFVRAVRTKLRSISRKRKSDLPDQLGNSKMRLENRAGLL